MKLFTFITAGSFILLSAFIMKKNNTRQTASLYESKWTLKKIHTGKLVEDVNTSAFIRFNKEKKSAGGNGSCNSFGSDFILNDNKISFKNIFSTKMYCEGVQQTEDSFFKQLERADRFKINDKNLLLYRGDELLLEFTTS